MLIEGYVIPGESVKLAICVARAGWKVTDIDGSVIGFTTQLTPISLSG